MTHASQTFTAHVLGLLKNHRSHRSSGPSPRKPLFSNEKVGTTRAHEVGPVENDRSQPVNSTWSRQERKNNYLRKVGPVGPVGTQLFLQGP